MNYIVYYGTKDIDAFNAESEEQAIEFARESNEFRAEKEEE